MDAIGKKAGLLCVALLALVPTLAQEDTSPPALVEFSFSPTSVDATGGPSSVTFTARITDALSGVSYWCVELFSQSGQQAQGQCFFEGPVSGDANNGTFQGTLTLPQYAEQGQWRVFRVTLFDRAGNWLALSGNELEMAGFPTALTVNSMQDTAAPTLEGFDFSPDMVDTSSSPASVTFTARITDALSGVSYWCVELFSQSGQQAQGQCFFEGPVSGDLNNGTFQGTLTLPQYAEQGQWRVFRVTLFDRVGNWLALSGNELETAGFPTVLTVNSMQDTAAPTLEGFDFSPDMVDTSSSPATVTFTARITDALSGVSYWCVELFSQSGQQAQGQCFFEGPVSGDLNNGTFQGTLTLPQYAEQGQWRVFRVTLFDRVGNWLALSADQLAALSFPTELLNGPQIIPVQIDIKPGSSTNSINLGSQGTVPVAILSTPTFDARTVDPLSITLASATVAVKGKGTPMASFQDVNQDGLLDLVVHVETQALQLTVGDTVAILEGQTFDGRRIRGSDTVRVVP